MKKLIILSLGVLLIAAACNKADNGQTQGETTPPPAATPPATSPPATNPPSPSPSTTNVTVTYNGAFSPGEVNVKKGTTVTFANNSSSAFWPASGPHPSHTNYPEFDPKKGIAAGSTWSFTFDKVGTWAFHDHLNPTRFGKVIVTE